MKLVFVKIIVVNYNEVHQKTTVIVWCDFWENCGFRFRFKNWPSISMNVHSFILRVPSSLSSLASWWHPLLLRGGSTSRHPVLWSDTSWQCEPWSVALRKYRLARPRLCMLAQHGPWPVRKQFNRDKYAFIKCHSYLGLTCIFLVTVLLMLGSYAACRKQCVQAVLQESTGAINWEFETLKEFFCRMYWIPPDV